jgi:septal ring factor EnvC (AmiA/AmiB activator)
MNTLMGTRSGQTLAAPASGSASPYARTSSHLRRWLATLALLPLAALAQTAPNAPDPLQQRERIARVQAQIEQTRSARARIERELADLQRQIDRLRLEQQRLRSDELRLQSDLTQLQTAPR